METEPIRVALINGSHRARKADTEEFQKFGECRVVYTAQDAKTNFKQMVQKRPDVVIVSTGSPNTFHHELDPNFSKIRKSMPGSGILLVTELPITHPFVQQAINGGASVLDERWDIHKKVEVIQKMKRGEQVVIYINPGIHDLDTYQPLRLKMQNETSV